MADQKAGPMGVEELDELERLEQAATQAPWRDWIAPEPFPWATIDGGPEDHIIAQMSHYYGKDGEAKANAALIAAMRNALPRLLALARSALTAEAAGREKGLEDAARWVRLGRWHDPDSCAAGILAQPSATRKEE